MMPDAHTVYDVIDGTWPAATYTSVGAFTVRDGQGGGNRVSSATALRTDWTNDDIHAAEEAMDALNQPRQFMIREGDELLDVVLEERGYKIAYPVVLYAIPSAELAKVTPPRVSTFEVWSPLAISYDIWDEAGIGPKRWQVMDRAKGPKTSILGRWNDSPGGTAFVAIHDGIAMLHALEVLPHQRRTGMGAMIMAQAGIWAQRNGARHLTVVVTEENTAARKLYAKIGMTEIGRYHYRQKPKD